MPLQRNTIYVAGVAAACERSPRVDRPRPRRETWCRDGGSPSRRSRLPPRGRRSSCRSGLTAAGGEHVADGASSSGAVETSPTVRRPLHTRGRLSCVVASADNTGWSLYGAPWLQPVAIGRKWDGTKNGSDKRKRLPWVATNCRADRMVRRGSTVRVRQRALHKRRKSRLSVKAPCWVAVCGGYGAVYGAFRFQKVFRRRNFSAIGRRGPQGRSGIPGGGQAQRVLRRRPRAWVYRR
jgi:hypothetical protein